MILTVIVIVVVAAFGLVGYNQRLQAQSQRQFVEQSSAAVSRAVTDAVNAAVQSIVAPPIVHPQLDKPIPSQYMPGFEQHDDELSDLDLYDPTDAIIPNDRPMVANGLDTGIEGFHLRAPHA